MVPELLRLGNTAIKRDSLEKIRLFIYLLLKYLSFILDLLDGLIELWLLNVKSQYNSKYKPRLGISEAVRKHS